MLLTKAVVLEREPTQKWATITILGGLLWKPSTGLLSIWCHIFMSSDRNSFEDWTLVDFIYGCPIFKWVDETWHPLQWRHDGRDCVSNDQSRDCLLNRLFRLRSKKTSKLRVTSLCAGNSPGPVNSPHKWPVTWKMFPFDDVIMPWQDTRTDWAMSPNTATPLVRF